MITESILIGLFVTVLLSIHFGVPVVYYLVARAKWLNNKWGIRFEESYLPRVRIFVPAFNEARNIQERLNNLETVEYPRELYDIVVVDDASSDDTITAVQEWAKSHTRPLVRWLHLESRHGKLRALDEALKQFPTEAEIVVFTDADVSWASDSLRNAVKYFADTSVGAVTSQLGYSGRTSDTYYRDYFNVIRIAESKRYSTPIHNGSLLAIRNDLLQRFGLPLFPGSDDSSFGSYFAFLGWRAIQVDDVRTFEVPSSHNWGQKIRRAQCLLACFLHSKEFAMKERDLSDSPFDRIWKVEWWLHVVNPWVLLAAVALLFGELLAGATFAAISLLLGAVMLLSRTYRMWIVQQIFLIRAALGKPKEFW